jgi:ABC-type dipeptide/oligopeptide/nickel transport system permease subunit
MDPRKLRVLVRHRAAMAGLGLVLFIAVCSGLVGWASPYDPAGGAHETPHLGPSLRHWMGTDYAGRDILTRIFVGARISLLIGVACVLFSLGAGVPLGAAAGYFGGLTDQVISRLVDILLSFPSILLAIAIAAPQGASLRTVILAVGVVGVPQIARQVRASVLSLREQEFVMASTALGAGPVRILFREILPNAMGPIIVLSTLGVGSSILDAAGLSFIGLGVEAGTAEWGRMLHDGYTDRELSPYLAIFSGLAISLAVLGFNLFGDGLRDALDPKSGQTR